MEDVLVYIPSKGINKAGNKLYTKLHNAINKLQGRYNQEVVPDATVVEYKLVPTGKVYDYKGELVEK